MNPVPYIKQACKHSRQQANLQVVGASSVLAIARVPFLNAHFNRQTDLLGGGASWNSLPPEGRSAWPAVRKEHSDSLHEKPGICAFAEQQQP